MEEEKLIKKIMSIQTCLSIYTSIYTLIEMIYQSLPSSKAQITVIRPTPTEIQPFRFTMKQNVCILTGSLKARMDPFVGKRGEIQVLKSMTKFTVALKETCFTLGVLQLISMAGRSRLRFTLLPVPHTNLLIEVYFWWTPSYIMLIITLEEHVLHCPIQKDCISAKILACVISYLMLEGKLPLILALPLFRIVYTLSTQVSVWDIQSLLPFPCLSV